MGSNGYPLAGLATVATTRVARGVSFEDLENVATKWQHATKGMEPVPPGPMVALATG